MANQETLYQFVNKLVTLRNQQSNEGFSLQQTTALVLCFIAASISSAGGVGGGSLYLPILNLVAGLDLKTASPFSAFMVTGGSITNVLFNIFFTDYSRYKKSSLIDYEIAMLSEPCMLLGVGIGVICNVVFPEWLITALFAVFLAFSTYKTFMAGFKCWKAESEEAVREGVCQQKEEEDEGAKRLEEALLRNTESEAEENEGWRVPWVKLLVLLMVWLSFFVLHVLTADKDGKSIIGLRLCGRRYWLVHLSQIPLSIFITLYILHCNTSKSDVGSVDEQSNVKGNVAGVASSNRELPMVLFPLAALMSGILGGLFGIGGGLLINPVLLHIGVPPQITAATTSFMVLFSSSMSLVQYLILGMKRVKEALNYAIICSVASVVGLIIIQKAMNKSGRASFIVFSVGVVMALSTVSITTFGAVDVWGDYISGDSLGFRLPC